jgi:hypothetical protein
MADKTQRAQRGTRVSRKGSRRRFDTTARADLLDLLADGATIEDAAAQLGFDRNTPARFARSNPSFREALDRALDAGAWLRDTTTVFTDDMREALLDLCRQGLKPRPAARQLGLDAGNVGRYIAHDEAFRARVVDALAEAVDLVEHAAFREAQAGVPRLVEYVLNNRRPRKWRTARLIGIAGANRDGEPEGPIEVTDTTARDRDLIASALREYGPQFAQLGHALVEQQRREDGTES